MIEPTDDYRERALALMAEVVKQSTPPFDPMTNLRDWFAGMAVIGLMAGDHIYAREGETWEDRAARDAYKVSDSMISVRSAGSDR